jgi:hypothetical protein
LLQDVIGKRYIFSRLSAESQFFRQETRLNVRRMNMANLKATSRRWRGVAYLMLAVVALAGAAIYKVHAAGHGDGDATPLFGIKIPPGYRDWKLVSVAHKEGNLNDIRAILGNDTAITAYRKGTLPFPDGTIIARISWSYVPSEENNKVFGRAQSFVAGPPPDWYLQFMVKDSKKYAATGGWGFAQFDKDGKLVDDAKLKPCFPATSPSKLATLSSPVTHLNIDLFQGA